MSDAVKGPIGPITQPPAGPTIKIDREAFQISSKVLTGAQLRALPAPSIGPERDLFQVVPGGSDIKIADADPVRMSDGLRFFTAPAQINPGSN